MADLLNTNIGPERVEVIPQPLGIVPVPGASTAVTAFILRSAKANAPLNTPVEILNLDQFVDTFGDESDVGLQYFAVQGFYDNAGSGNKTIIVNVSPSASGSDVSENGVAEVGSNGLIIDESDINTGLSISSYVGSTGMVTFSGSPSLTSVKVGDYFKDDTGRLYAILSIDTANFKIEIAKNLFTLASHSALAAGGLKVGSTAGKIIRLFAADQFNSKALVQAGATKGAISITGVASNVVSASAGGFLNMGAKRGDILTDSGSAIFYITEVVDDNKVTVDRNGAATGSATVKAAMVNTIQATSRVASDNASPAGGQNVTAFSSSAAGYGILPTSVAPYAENSLANHFMAIGSFSKEILSNSIIASGSLNPEFGTSTHTFSYNSTTGVITMNALEDLSTATDGDVFRDASNNDFVINAADNTAHTVTISPGKTVNTATGSTIRDGQSKIMFKDATFNPGTSQVPSFFEPANQLSFDASSLGAAAAYFIADAVTQDSDYVGTAANGKGLHALDNTDLVNLVCIPEVTSTSVQNALIDYCEVQRNDCFALLAIPRNITSPVVDITKLSVTISTIVNGSEESTVSFSGTPNLSDIAIGDLLVFGASKYMILDVDEDDHKVTIQSISASGSGAASIIEPSAVTYKEIIINNPSKHAAWYINHLQVQRPADSSIAVVDPCGYVAGVMSRIDANISIGGVSHAPAGSRFAGIAGIVGLDMTISEKQHGEGLREAFINRITEFPGSGRLIFGAYTADSGTSPAFTAEEQLIQVERTILFIKNSLEPGLRNFIWENFSPATQLQAQNAILSFLRNNSYLFPAGLAEKDQFKVISVTPTTESLAKGLMKFRVQIRPNTAIRFIEIALEFPIPQSQG